MRKFRSNFELETWVGKDLRNIEMIPDPFAMVTFHIGWWDRLRVLFGTPIVLRIRGADECVIRNVMNVLDLEPKEIE